MKAQGPLGVILCTDKSLLGDLLEQALKTRPEIGWVRKASTGSEVLALVKDERPDAVLLDPAHPKESMFDLARKLARAKSDLPIVFFSESPSLGWIYRTLAVGAAGYISNCTDVGDFVRAIQAARRGMRFFSPSAATVVSNMATGTESIPSFSQRELEVLRLICEGNTTKDISRDLKMEPKTVDSVRARLMVKTRTTNAASLVRYACDERFVDARPREA